MLFISLIFSISIKLQFTDPFLCIISSDGYFNYRGLCYLWSFGKQKNTSVHFKWNIFAHKK